MKRLILLTLTLCVSTLTAMAVSYTIKTTAQSATSDVLDKIGEPNLIDVTSLTFEPGSTINGYDIMIIRNRMPKLTDLDMGEVTILANDHEYYTGYHSENDILGPYAFYQVSNLVNVTLPKSITAIGYNAFSSCANLKKVDFPDGAKIIMIGSSAFSMCNSLQSVELPEGLQYIDSGAFQMIYSLARVDFPSTLKYIANGAFMSCSGLSKITFVSNKEVRLIIEGNAFSYCSMLTNIAFPPQLVYIGYGAFQNCSGLTQINIPSAVKTIKDLAFEGCYNLNKVETNIAVPLHIEQKTFCTYQTAKVTYPIVGNSPDQYFWDTEWNQFLDLHPADPNNGDPNASGSGSGTGGDNSLSIYFYVPTNKDFEFADGDVRIDGEPDVDLYAGSGLTVEGEEIQKLGEIHLNGKDDSNNNMPSGDNNNLDGEFGSIIGNGNIEAKKLYFDLVLQSNRWHFMSFPFKVRRSDIVCKGNYIFRYYDSENRAKNGTTGWKDLPASEEYLYPGQGYIFQTDYYNDGMTSTTPSMGGAMGMESYSEPDPTISIPVDPNNLDFSGDNKSNTIKPYPSSNASNASWNFMGNPYPSYFDLDEVLYEGPITVWNGNGYECVKKGDDVYHFRPLEGFFIQKPENMSTVVFQAAGRHTYSQWAAIQAGKTAATRAAVASNRKLINLTISDGLYTDKTRVVFNPDCTDSYEIGTDATKFIAANVAQLYSVDSKAVQYAINERPAGEVRLGYVAAKGGEMTISASRMDTPIALYDKQMDVVFDLNKGSYTFATEAGTFNDRFLLVRDGQMTRIDAIHAEDAADAPVYSLDGRRVEQMKTNRVYITEGKKVIKK